MRFAALLLCSAALAGCASQSISYGVGANMQVLTDQREVAMQINTLSPRSCEALANSIAPSLEKGLGLSCGYAPAPAALIWHNTTQQGELWSENHFDSVGACLRFQNIIKEKGGKVLQECFRK